MGRQQQQRRDTRTASAKPQKHRQMSTRITEMDGRYGAEFAPRAERTVRPGFLKEPTVTLSLLYPSLSLSRCQNLSDNPFRKKLPGHQMQDIKLMIMAGSR